ncbi:MAG: VOC family protein [Anaerolineae bacterium]
MPEKNGGVGIVALDHMQISMPAGAENAAQDFYGALLGLTEVPKPASLAPRGGCWFVGQGVALHLGVEADFRPARKAHPAFRVADLEMSRARFEAAGVQTIPDEAVPSVRRFYVADPFGNRIEFIQDGDAFA